MRELKLKQLKKLNGTTYRVSNCKRPDISAKKTYLVRRGDYWYLGQFTKQWYGWSFHPNGASFSIQVEHLDDIFETEL